MTIYAKGVTIAELLLEKPESLQALKAVCQNIDDATQAKAA